ncbi:MAG: CoA transferase, partial [Clostridia bacterium]|nr:CoA transferase [Clostridia bacterium]
MPFLEGIRVVDASQYLPGQYATMLLADLGAEVIRLERPGEGDPSRRDWPGAFYTSNRNKKSLAVNLKAPEGQAVLHRLIRTADVFLEGYRPGVAARLGADDGTLRGLNPALVYVSITGYGQSGPYRDVTGHDINYIAMAGLLDIPGDLEQPPVMPGVPVAD